jgi:hypothetical protein
MFFELRTYDLKPGKAPVYLEFFRTFGLGLVTRHLPMMGYWLCETGRLNRIEHMWAYESFEERDACRASLVQDTAWMQDFVPKAFVDVVAQTNRFLTLTRSSPGFDTAVANRKAHHPNQQVGSATYASGLHGLTIADSPAPGERIASFTVASGPAPGQCVTLTRGAFDNLLQGNAGADTHEILRPLAVSPLR